MSGINQFFITEYLKILNTVKLDIFQAIFISGYGAINTKKKSTYIVIINKPQVYTKLHIQKINHYTNNVQIIYIQKHQEKKLNKATL